MWRTCHCPFLLLLYERFIPSVYQVITCLRKYTRGKQKTKPRAPSHEQPPWRSGFTDRPLLLYDTCGCFPMRSPTPCTLFLFFSHCCLSSFFNGNRDCGRGRVCGATLFTLCIIRNQRNLRGRNSACPAQYLAGDVIKPENNPK